MIYTRSWLAEQTTPVAFAFEDKVAAMAAGFRGIVRLKFCKGYVEIVLFKESE